eukprot:scaffold15632_cov193-Alexandrium_tamarense.AAC.2
MSERNAAARRRLDLVADASSPPGAVINSYSSPSRATRSGKQKESSSAVTPEDINKFLSPKKKVLPRTSRIITPDKKRKAIDLDGEEELYYSSGDEKQDA